MTQPLGAVAWASWVLVHGLAAGMLHRRGVHLGRILTVALTLGAGALACCWPMVAQGHITAATMTLPLVGTPIVALACGAWLAWHTGSLGAGPLAVGTLLTWQGMAYWAAAAGALNDIGAPALRGLVLSPAPVLLCGVFGASIMLLARGAPLRGAGGLSFIEVRLARRLLLSRTSGVLSLVTGISVVGVALGVWLVIVAMGILSGFEHDLVRKIIGANAHLVLSDEQGEPLQSVRSLAQTLASDPEILAAASVVEAELAVAGDSQYAAATVFGIEPDQAKNVIDVLHTIVAGNLGSLDAACSPLCPVVVGVELANSLNVTVGDRLRLISATQEVLTPIGPAPKSLGLVVRGIFSSKMYDYDSRYIFMGIDAARKFTALPSDAATAMQLRVADPDAMQGVQSRVLAAAQNHQHHSRTTADQPKPADHLQALTWMARNQALFSALALERVVAGVVLAFIILVASFSIVNTLTMSILERRHEIAILKTMGARDATILRIFLAQGVLIGTLGLGMGVTMGVGTLWVLGRIPLGIPYEVYYLDALPVRISFTDIGWVALLAWLIVWNFAVFPSLAGAALRPVEGLRDG